MTGDPQNHKLH